MDILMIDMIFNDDKFGSQMVNESPEQSWHNVLVKLNDETESTLLHDLWMENIYPKIEERTVLFTPIGNLQASHTCTLEDAHFIQDFIRKFFFPIINTNIINKSLSDSFSMSMSVLES